MKRINTFGAALLAASVPLSGCATTHLRGQYRTAPADPMSMKHKKQLLAKGSEWPLFWGIFEVGSYDATKDLNKKLRPDEAINNLEIRDRVSVGGVFLWIITAGILTHHTVEIRGEPAVISRPPAEPGSGTSAAPARERETIVVPATPAPAGYERDRTTRPEERPDVQRADKSADYNEGYRDGLKDRDLDNGAKETDKSFRGDRSSDYNEGYRDALKDATRKD